MMRAGKDYGVEVITAYENRRVGQVFFPPGLLRDALVRTGRVKRLTAPSGKLPLQPASDEAHEDAGRGRRKQGRLGLVTT